jgi:threonine dehydrogenase-like Zn-dependent dehydrogenase
MLEDGVATQENGWFEVYEIQRVVPKTISVEAAVLLCTWREVYAGFGDFGLKKGDHILVFGAGPVGLSFIKFGKMLRLGYIGVVEPIEEKRNLAEKMGADATFEPDSQELSKIKGSLDAIVDAVGNERIINSSLQLIKPAGSICVYGVIDKPSLLIEKALGPYNFNLLVHQWPTRWREAAAQEPLCEWIASGDLKSSEFISHEFTISDVREALSIAHSGKALKVLLRF